MIGIQEIDINILNYIQENIRNPLLDKIMPFITSFGNMALLWIIIGMVLFSIKKHRKYGYMVFLALLLCFLIGNLALKPLVARIRPFDAYPLINGLLINAPKDFSFPSGHTMCSFAPSVVLFYFNKKIGVCALVISVLIALSRLYLYVHYPSDVLCGMIIGVINGIISINVINKFYHKM